MLITGEITFESVEKVFSALTNGTLDQLFICTPGGRVDAAWAIYDLIVGRGVQVIGLGSVASAGLIIMLGGDQRCATDSTRFMSHPIQVQGNLEAHGVEFEELNVLSRKYQDALVSRAGMSAKMANTFATKTTYFGVEEALRNGFLNSTVEIRDVQEEAS